MEIVNGFPCQNCTDVEFAKKGIDPAHPKDAVKNASSRGDGGEAKSLGVNRPQSLGDIGRNVSLYA